MTAAPLDLDRMPPAIQALARRNERFHGNGSAAAPFVGGWFVDGRALSYDHQGHAWLKAHGFTHCGRSWCRADDVDEGPALA